MPSAERYLSPIIDSGLPDKVADSAPTSDTGPIFSEDLALDLNLSPLANSCFAIASPSSGIPDLTALKADWFTAPDSWHISHEWNRAVMGTNTNADMKIYIARVQSWLQRWINTGSNPFIHKKLYSVNFPASVQIAYATLASYIHRTPSNTDTVLKIVEDRSTALLRDNGAVLQEEKWVCRQEEEEDHSVDLFAQLARLHALMTYQMIGLFDGDIRARYFAEGRLALQNAWAIKLFHAAGSVLPNADGCAVQLVGSLPRWSDYAQQQWYSWILAESIRRTYMVAVSIMPIYTALQQGWAKCPGGIKFTNRSGLWGATSAVEWEKQCREKGAGFLHRSECDWFLDNATPGDVDEFGIAVMDMTFRSDLLQRWREKGRGVWSEGHVGFV
ncbi:hypothetical protein ACJQWK_04896 [Exserohilum turcicum]